MYGLSKSRWTTSVFLIAHLVQQVYPLPSATTCSLQDYQGNAEGLLANHTLAVEDDDNEDDNDNDKASDASSNSTIETRTDSEPKTFPPQPGRIALGQDIWRNLQRVLGDPRPDRPPNCDPRINQWKVLVNPPTGEDPSLPGGISLDLEMWSKIDAPQVSAGAPTTDWNRDSRWTTISAYSEVNIGNGLGLFEYRNAYSPWTGSIICLEQRNKIFTSGRTYTAPGHWGIPSFACWNTYATAENIPVSSLKRIAMQRFTSRAAKDLLFWALRGKTKVPIDPTRPSDGSILSAYVTLDSDADVFFALLTIPFVKSVANMLKDHSSELGRKTVSGFSVSLLKTRTGPWSNSFNLVIDLQPYDPNGVRPAS